MTQTNMKYNVKYVCSNGNRCCVLVGRTCVEKTLNLTVCLSWADRRGIVVSMLVCQASGLASVPTEVWLFVQLMWFKGPPTLITIFYLAISWIFSEGKAMRKKTGHYSHTPCHTTIRKRWVLCIVVWHGVCEGLTLHTPAAVSDTELVHVFQATYRSYDLSHLVWAD